MGTVRANRGSSSIEPRRLQAVGGWNHNVDQGCRPVETEGSSSMRWWEAQCSSAGAARAGAPRPSAGRGRTRQNHARAGVRGSHCGWACPPPTKPTPQHPIILAQPRVNLRCRRCIHFERHFLPPQLLSPPFGSRSAATSRRPPRPWRHWPGAGATGVQCRPCTQVAAAPWRWRDWRPARVGCGSSLA